MNSLLMDTSDSPLNLFAGFGIELEYMLVDHKTLNVAPVADQILHLQAGNYSGDAEDGQIAWSNELVAHVLEFKGAGPFKTLKGVATEFQRSLLNAQQILQTKLTSPATLLPTAMHPWMNPTHETVLWPHENSEIYQTYDRIFNCQGHGWSNLQSVHLNLPFANDHEFAKLHTAIRLLLPILPALAASSPLVEGKWAECADQRLDFYQNNSKKIPSITGKMIPEPVESEQQYHDQIYAPMLRDIAAYDPTGVLQQEFLNSRAAIARFDRHAIEIRILDIQECPQADLAIIMLIVRVLQNLCSQDLCPYPTQLAFSTHDLWAILQDSIFLGDANLITNSRYLTALGIQQPMASANEVWQHLFTHCLPPNDPYFNEAAPYLEVILKRGCLAQRIKRFLKPKDLKLPTLQETYRQISQCLLLGRQFTQRS